MMDGLPQDMAEEDVSLPVSVVVLALCGIC